MVLDIFILSLIMSLYVVGIDRDILRYYSWSNNVSIFVSILKYVLYFYYFIFLFLCYGQIALNSSRLT